MRKIRWSLIGISFLTLLILVGWKQIDNNASVTFCDVGQGDAMLFRKGEWEMLVDTGPPTNKVLGCLSKEMPFWDKTIEVVIVTHWDTDHCGGLPAIMKYYKIDNLYSFMPPKDKNEQKIYTNDLVSGDRFDIGLMRFEVLNPDHDWGDENENSVVGCLSYGDRNILMTADITAAVEQRLVWREELGRCQKAEILKVAHHGSAEATSEELLKAIKPKLAVISVGAKNRFGHPTKTVLDRLSNWGINIWRTDEQGGLRLEL